MGDYKLKSGSRQHAMTTLKVGFYIGSLKYAKLSSVSTMLPLYSFTSVKSNSIPNFIRVIQLAAQVHGNDWKEYLFEIVFRKYRRISLLGN